MRYCCYCGNPLTPGSSFCHTCGAALKAVVPEADEAPVATPVAEEAVAPVVDEVAAPVAEIPAVVEAPAPAPVVVEPNFDKDVQDEKKFLEDTHKFLRWERTALSIAGKVHLIMGIAFAALFAIIAIGIGTAAGMDEGAIASAAIFFMNALLYGSMFIGLGIVNLKAADKIPQYTDTMYKDFRAAHKRCTSIGMIVFNYFFNTIALVFFVINFARLKSNRAMCDRIMTRQGVK